MHYKTFVANIRLWSIRHYNTISVLQDFCHKIKLRSLRHKRSSSYAASGSVIHEATRCQQFLKKQNLQWLVGSKTRPKETERIVNQYWQGVITSHGACARMKDGNLTNNLTELFPDTKGGCKSEACISQDLFLLQMVPLHRCIFKSVKHLRWSFLRN